MNLYRLTFLCLISLFCMHTASLYVFIRGFLLSRSELGNVSQCIVEKETLSTDHRKNLVTYLTPSFKSAKCLDPAANYSCCPSSSFTSVVLLIIDGLRYDFAVPSHDSSQANLPSYANKFPVLGELLVSHPRSAQLYKFIADPPTTTMQRLKGMTTGSLPTFVEVGANFASSEIKEDNIIDQIVMSGLKVTFMGDDTWTGLFPNRFHRQYSFPSFNVKDLHTVDNGIIDHLVPEIKLPDWDVLIAHFLGVDHCGHRYGPHHPSMAEKLNQMDRVVRSVVAELPNDTLLLVMGDHGMTKTGDHGGDSADEVDSALFVFSHKPFMDAKRNQSTRRAVSQIDIVPTLSLLLGLPVPFSNLGTIIPELFSGGGSTPSDLKGELSVVEALLLNSVQVARYLDEYTKTNKDFPYIKYKQLKKQLNSSMETWASLRHNISAVNISASINEVKDQLINYLDSVKSMSQQVWAKFDVVAICGGICLSVLTIMAGMVITRNIHCIDMIDKSGTTATKWFTFSTLMSSSMLFIFFCILPDLSAISVAVAMLITVTVYLMSQAPFICKANLCRPSTSMPLLESAPLFVVVVYSLAVFSNSYVVHEDSTSSFLCQSLIWVLFIVSCQHQAPPLKPKREQHKTRPVQFDLYNIITDYRFVLFCMAIGLNCVLRFSQEFWRCREEQWDCELSRFTQPLSAISAMTVYKNTRYFTSLLAVCLLPYLLRLWMRHFGNLNGHAISVIAVKYALPLMSVSVSLYWAFTSLSQSIIDKLPSWQHMMFPFLVYGLAVCCIGVIVISPLFIYQPEKMLYAEKDKKLIPQVYYQMNLQWQQHMGQAPTERHAVTVYGLATVYSSVVITVLVIAAVVLLLLLGDGFAWGVFLLLTSMFLFLEMYSCVATSQVSGIDKVEVPWWAVVMWQMIAFSGFYTTGHQASFPTINWDAAYTGFHGDYVNNIVPGILLLLNTYASYVLFALATPLLIIWPFSQGRSLAKLGFPTAYKTNQRDEELQKQGEFVLQNYDQQFRLALNRLCIMVVTAHGLKVLAAMASAGLHRRHLMVWKIFAPKFMFEGVGFVVMSATLMFSYTLVLRVHGALGRWVNKLQQ